MPETLNIALGWMIIHSLWQATLIALVIGMIMVALRKKTANLRYVIANIGLLTVLLTATLTFAWYYKEATQPITIDAAPLLQKQAQIVQKTLDVSPKFTPNDVSPTSKLWSVANFKAYFEQNLPLVVLLWLIGVAVLLLRLVGSLGYIQYLRRRMNFPPDEYWTEMLSRLLAQAGLSKTVEMVESALVRTPMVVGHLKPLIMFPIGMINRLSEQEVEAILAHEIAHILRNDFIFNILQSIVEALFYYHPAVWLLSAQIRDERESACDEIAIDLIGGKTMNYAKALVVLQEMAFFPLSASLAFAGNRKNQFLLRLQRILHQPQNKSFLMEKLIATLLVLFTLIGFSTAQQEQPKYAYNNTQPNSLMVEGENSFSTKGYWNATLENEKICLTLNNGSRNGNFITTECFDKSEFSALPSNTEGTFTLKRAAGIITFTGKFEGNEGYGKQVFEPNVAFKNTLSQNGITNANDELSFFAFIAKADDNYFTSLKSLNISGLDETEMRNFLTNRVTIEDARDLVEYFKSNNKEDISPSTIIDFCSHNITLKSIEKIEKLFEKNLNLHDILNAGLYEVDENFVNSFRSVGLNNLNIVDATNLKIYGVTPDYVANLTKQFGKNFSVNDIVNSTIHGINDENIAAAKNLAGKDATFDDVLKVRIHGVTQDFVNSFHSVGFSNLNLDEATTLKIHGVTPEFVRSFFQAGLKNINFEDAVALKIHDVSPDFIKKQRKKGNKSSNAQDFVEIKLQGNESYAFAGNSFSSLIPPLPPLSPLSNRSFPSENGKSGKFGHSEGNNGVVTWFNYDYKIITKKNKIDKAYYKDKEMNSTEIVEMKEALESMVDEIKDYSGNVAAAVPQEELAEQQRELAKQQNKLQGYANRSGASSGSHGIGHGVGHGEGHSSGHGAGHGGSSDLENKALSWFIKELHKDKYFEIGKKTEFSITRKGLSVGGKAVSGSIFTNYKANIERILGKKMGKSFIYRFKGVISSIVGDSVQTSGELEISTN